MGMAAKMGDEGWMIKDEKGGGQNGGLNGGLD
jgi:hypothetical protein